MATLKAFSRSNELQLLVIIILKIKLKITFQINSNQLYYGAEYLTLAK